MKICGKCKDYRNTHAVSDISNPHNPQTMMTTCCHSTVDLDLECLQFRRNYYIFGVAEKAEYARSMKIGYAFQ